MFKKTNAPMSRPHPWSRPDLLQEETFPAH